MATASALDGQLQSIVASAKNGASHQQLREASQKFEAMFLSQMLNTMSQGLDSDTSSPFGGGPEEATYRSMLNDKYAEAVAKKGGIGLSTRIYGEMLKLQDVQGKDRK